MITEKLIELGKEIEASVDKLLELREKGQTLLNEKDDIDVEKIITSSEELSTLNDRVTSKLKQLI